MRLRAVNTKFTNGKLVVYVNTARVFLKATHVVFCKHKVYVMLIVVPLYNTGILSHSSSVYIRPISYDDFSCVIIYK